MTEIETIQLLHRYYEIVKPIYNCWCGDNLSSSIVKILQCSSKRKNYKGFDTIDIKAVVHSNSRTYTYETTDSRDEGWGSESGDFFNERTITVPSFIFDVGVLDEQIVLNILFVINNQYKVKQLRNKISDYKRQIEEADDMLRKMEIDECGDVDVRIERGTLVKTLCNVNQLGDL